LEWYMRGRNFDWKKTDSNSIVPGILAFMENVSSAIRTVFIYR
jgi:CDP-glycerol glycerophosphotransferase (TagB/SpsB family)